MTVELEEEVPVACQLQRFFGSYNERRLPRPLAA